MSEKEVKRSRLLATLAEMSEVFIKEQEEYDLKNDEWWNSLSETEREDAFYAVLKRLYKGEIVDEGSYRYVLYDVFGFDPGMYSRGMACGYMELHNRIMSKEHLDNIRKSRYERIASVSTGDPKDSC